MWPVRPGDHRSRWRLAEIQQIEGDAHVPQHVVVCVLPRHAEEDGFGGIGAARVSVVGSLIQACANGQVAVMVPLAEESAHVLCSLWGIIRKVRWIVRNLSVVRPYNEFGMT